LLAALGAEDKLKLLIKIYEGEKKLVVKEELKKSIEKLQSSKIK
jgi:hypothetical protein